jgi:signal transduction histidine kinase
LRCDGDGHVEAVLRNDLDIDNRKFLGRSFADICEPHGRSSPLEFLAEIKRSSAAFDWAFLLSTDERGLLLRFAGVREAAGPMLLVGELAAEEAAPFWSERTTGRTNSGSDQQPSGDGEIFAEITRLNNELANMQREMAKSNADLARLNEQKNLWLGMAAHDLRTPLGAIMSFSEFILAEADESLEHHHREFLSLIHSSSKSMLALVNDLLDISQIEAGELRLEPVPVDLVELVRRYVSLSRPLAERREISISLEVGDEVPTVSVDPGKFGQVLNNLLDNALRFSPEGSEVRVAVTGTKESVEVLVSDQGPGIPPDLIANIFEPFKTQGRGAGKRGTGLGLAIVKRIVDGHRGEIHVESELGRGTTFCVKLSALSLRVSGRPPGNGNQPDV